MITVLSPAKTLDYSANYNDTHSVPSFLKKSGELVKELKQKEPSEIASLMGLSDKLASLNFDRYQSWKAEKKISDNSKPALLVFKGDVYQGLQAEDFKKGDLNFAQKHLRILSGLYGALKPLDVMNPYRLEMGTKLQINGWKNLYEFHLEEGPKENKIIKELKNRKIKLTVTRDKGVLSHQRINAVSYTHLTLPTIYSV